MPRRKPKVPPEDVAEALGAKPMPPEDVKKLRAAVGKVLKVRLSKQVKLFLASLPPKEQEGLVAAMASIPERILRGEAPVPMTPEEIQRLKDEEGLDLEAIVHEMNAEKDDLVN